MHCATSSAIQTSTTGNAVSCPLSPLCASEPCTPAGTNADQSLPRKLTRACHVADLASFYPLVLRPEARGSQPETLRHAPYTLHHTPCTGDPRPLDMTLDHRPWTLDPGPKPKTRDPRPKTLDP
eukprot:3482882-Rhodomonas_salina.1